MNGLGDHISFDQAEADKRTLLIELPATTILWPADQQAGNDCGGQEGLRIWCSTTFHQSEVQLKAQLKGLWHSLVFMVDEHQATWS